MATPDPYAVAHRAVEALFEAVLTEIGGASAERIEAEWTRAERALLEHFDREERTVLAELLIVRPREGRVVIEEHSYLRRRLNQLRATLPALSVDALRTFVDELNAHGRHEERVLGRWADVAAPEPVVKPPV